MYACLQFFMILHFTLFQWYIFGETCLCPPPSFCQNRLVSALAFVGLLVARVKLSIALLPYPRLTPVAYHFP